MVVQKMDEKAEWYKVVEPNGGGDSEDGGGRS